MPKPRVLRTRHEFLKLDAVLIITLLWRVNDVKKQKIIKRGARASVLSFANLRISRETDCSDRASPSVYNNTFLPNISLSKLIAQASRMRMRIELKTVRVYERVSRTCRYSVVYDTEHELCLLLALSILRWSNSCAQERRSRNDLTSLTSPGGTSVICVTLIITSSTSDRARWLLVSS